MFLKKYAQLYRFKPYFAKYRGLLALLIGCMVVASSMGVVLSYLSSRQLVAISNTALEAMATSTLMIIISVLIHHAAWFLWDRFAALISSRVAEDIRRDVFSGVLSTRYAEIREKSVGYYLERLNDDADEISYFVPNVAGTLVDMLTNVSFLVIIFFQNWQCALLFTIGIIALYLVDLYKIRVELKYTREIKQLNEKLDTGMTETIRGIRDIKGLGIRGEVARRNEAVSGELARKRAHMKSEVAFWERVRTFGQWLIDALIVWMCAFWLLPAGQITAVVILILFNYKGLMYDTISCLSKIKNYYVQGEFKANRIREILDTSERESYGSEAVSADQAVLEVRNLSFSYGDRAILRNVSFRLEPGTASVLLGPSGGGKSTLFGLLTRLYSPQGGEIRLNGVALQDIDEQSLSRRIGIVNQEPFLFGDTIFNNLRIVRPEATEEEVYAACRKAFIHDEILGMKDGYATFLTENGSNLSGGQKQRLSIARAILKNTPVMLFDEPTSALDRHNQSLFMNTLAELKKTRTIFVIAHKLDDLSPFDQVFSLQDAVLKPHVDPVSENIGMK